MQRLRAVDWARLRAQGLDLFAKLIRTKDPHQLPEQVTVTGQQRLSRCLSTLDLTSLGVGSCVGTGMYLVAGLVARQYAGPAVILSFLIAAVASIFSGACYAEFGVRVPNTSGSAYMYSYVSVGEFIAFIIGWNMVLEYLIGTSACARALSACADSLVDGAVSEHLADSVGTVYGKPPDLVASGITLLMTLLLGAGVRKSLLFNHVLNGINLTAWVFIMGAGLFYVDLDNWTQHGGFMPYGWAGVFYGAATCFYAFIGFDIIATTGEEANDPARSIPLAIVASLAIILLAYVSISAMLTLIVPFDQIVVESALVAMFGQVGAPVCKAAVAAGALAGLGVSMFGSMFPMPRVIYAMAQDGLIFRQLAQVWPRTGTPLVATLVGGACAACVALVVQLEVLVEMMSIGTLLAYTVVSTCVLVLRYQPRGAALVELLPLRLRSAHPRQETSFSGFQGEISPQTNILVSSQRVMVRRVTRSSPDSDDTLHDESEEFGRDDAFLMTDRSGNNFYVPGGAGGGGGGGGGSPSALARWWDALGARLSAASYLCPALCPWVDLGPATDTTGMFVVKAVGALYLLIIALDLLAACGAPGAGGVTDLTMGLLFCAILLVLLAISRKPQNRSGLMYAAPGLPFVPAIAVGVNIYLILNLSLLTLLRFTVWMAIGLVVYFKYGIEHSSLARGPAPAAPATPAAPAAPSPRRDPDRNIFEGYAVPSTGPYASDNYCDPLLAWHESELVVPSLPPRAAPPLAPPGAAARVHLEQRYDADTNRATSHARRPPWACPDQPFDSWAD